MASMLRRRLLLSGLIVAIFAGSLLIYVIFGHPKAPIACGCAIPPTGDWIYQQRVVQGELGTFTVEGAQIAGSDLRLFYAFESVQQSAPLITVTSSTTTTPLPARVQTLEQVGDINIGVVHTTHPDHSGQTLTLAISAAGPKPPAMSFITLRQQHSERDSGNNRFAVMVTGDGTDEHGQPFFNSYTRRDVSFSSIWTNTGLFGTFSIHPSGQSTSTMFYFRSDASVVSISEQEYESRTGQHSSSAGQ